MKSSDIAKQYYESWESRLGYLFLLRRAQHCGYYPDGTADAPVGIAQARLRQELYKRLKPESGQRILDAGSGQGIIAVDEILTAKALAEQEQLLGSCSFSLEDYTKTTFPDRYFDSIFTVETLSHAYDIIETLKEFYRLLKPGGRLVLFEYTIADGRKFPMQDRAELQEIITRSLLGLPDFRHGQFRQTIGAAGFMRVQEEGISKQIMPFASYLHAWATVPYYILKLIGLEKRFINIAGGYKALSWMRADLLRYTIFTAKK
jgi:sterol 24-C-methyltransferase